MSRLLKVLSRGSLILMCSFWTGCDDGSCSDDDDPCDVSGELRCAPHGGAVEECTVDENGCLSWSVRRTCPGVMTCVDNGDGARCECVNDCERPGESICDDDVARYCRESDEGCLYWFDTDCGRMDQSCVISSGIAECVADCESNCFRRGATRCGSELEVETCSEVSDGCLRWDVTEVCSDESQRCDDSGEEATCIEVCISQCEDVGTSRCSAAGDVETCVDPGDGCLLWEVTSDCVDGQICEERGGAAGCFDEVDCGDGVDDDGDGYTDCDDDECFGVTPACVTEVNCRDGADNDSDLLADCDDDDCAGSSACVPMGLWELFHVLDENDMEGCALVFTPDGDAESQYAALSSCACAAEWIETPGSGDLSTVLALSDDEGQEVTLTIASDLPFYDRYWSSVFVGSNGYVTFGEADVEPSSSTDEFFGVPRIAPLDADLDPSTSGTVTIDEWPDRIAVTYDGVAFVDSPDATASFQVVLEAAGTISFVYQALGFVGEGFVGITNGVDDGPFPEQLDLVTKPPTPTQPGDVIFTEIHFNSEAVDDELGEFIEVLNVTDTELSLSCCVIGVGEGSHEISALTVPGGGTVVLARNDDPLSNGGIADAYMVGADLVLDDVMSEELVLECGGVVIDEVDFEGVPWPAGGSGRSLQLSSLVSLGALNDDPALWCASSAFYGAGDEGSPGLENNDCGPRVHVIEDFEVDPGWSSTGDWEWGNPYSRYLSGPRTCGQGAECYGTNMFGEYSNDHAGSSNVLIFGPLDLRGVTSAYLLFEMWLDAEPDGDGLRVVVADGVTTTTVYPVIAPYYDVPVAAPSMWSGDFGDDWFLSTIDLEPIAGVTEAYVFWQLETDSEDTAAGAYIDMVELIGF